MLVVCWLVNGGEVGLHFPSTEIGTSFRDSHEQWRPGMLMAIYSPFRYSYFRNSGMEVFFVLD
jgi:hypothetical protein